MRSVRIAATAVALVAALVLPLNGPAALADTVSVNCASQSLQTAIDSVGAATVILVKGTCHGNFVVDKNLTLKGNPTATLDGGGAATTLTVTGTRVIHLRSLVVTGGHGETGGGIRMDGGGVLTLDDVTVQDNVVVPKMDGYSAGGGIYALDATVAIRHSSLLNNRVVSVGSVVATADGGALYMINGTLTVTDASFRGNRATAQAPSGGAGAHGGAIFGISTPMTIDASRFRGNRATASADSSANAQAGALLFQADNSEDISISGSTFAGNIANAIVTGPSSGTALAGAAMITGSNLPVEADVTSSLFRGNKVTMTSANAALAEGGAVEAFGEHLSMHLVSTQVLNSTLSATGGTRATGSGGGLELGTGTMTIAHSEVSGNNVVVHSGSDTAVGTGGGIDSFSTTDITVTTSTLDSNGVNVHSDASLSNARGGGYASGASAALELRTSTIANNRADATASNGSTSARGGGLDLESPTNIDMVVNSTITGNSASASGPNAIAAGGGAEVGDAELQVRLATIAHNEVAADGSFPFAGGGGLDIEMGTTFLHGTILAANTAAADPNCIGAFTTEGFNLYGDITGCSVTPAGTDQANAAPKLSSLADHGGPTLTLALLAGSPALNKIPVVECHGMAARDQRQIVRPQGPLCDIGAFERTI